LIPYLKVCACAEMAKVTITNAKMNFFIFS
jgi:hypothetical protein